jgi:hypothetical protein
MVRNYDTAKLLAFGVLLVAATAMLTAGTDLPVNGIREGLALSF